MRMQRVKLKGLFITLAALGALTLGGLAALAVRSLAVPSASADPVAPNPGHGWTQVEGHGVDGGTYWLGTTADQALELRVNGARALRLEPNAQSPNVIGGHSGNWVASGVSGATIGGGGQSGSANRVTDLDGTVGGGASNQAGNNSGTVIDVEYATVGGGFLNTASGVTAVVGGGLWNTASGHQSTVAGGQINIASNAGATVGGGEVNTASGEDAAVGGGYRNSASGEAAAIGGGSLNTASGSAATVGGGGGNTASNSYATVPGGTANAALGEFSFAAGRRGKANNAGCFVWGDSTDADVSCSNDNRFVARASGGVYLYTTADLTSGAYLAAGSGSWSAVSSRDVKENFTAVDGQDVLTRLVEVPITTWNYRAQEENVRHMGPMAQDFYDAFGLGDSDTAITTVDTDGVALAAIQGLYELSQEQAARVQSLEEENAGLREQIDGLEARVSALEAGAPTVAAARASSSGVPVLWPLLGGGLALAAVGLVLAGRQMGGGRP